MSEMIDLRDVERRAWTLYYQDGLWDIFFGLLFLGGGLRALTDNLWFYLLVAAGILVFILGKRWITLPRLGQIQFSAQRKARTAVVRIVALGAMIVTAVIFILIVTGSDLSGLPLNWLFVIMVPGVFLLMATMMDFTRLYGYAVLVAVFTVLGEFVGNPAAAWAQIIAGLVPLAVGIVLLARFLRRYPVVDEAALAEGGDNGRS
ncbi:MAG: hypothetical protein ACK2UJ_19735 [Candidatus Promineifilaceae bacterium]|jgi:hypothetical protein